MARPVLVGIDPGNNGPDPLGMDGASGRRIADLSGLAGDQYLSWFDRINLFSSPGVRATRVNRAAGRNLLPILRGRKVVALGELVADALGVPYLDWFRWGRSGEFVVAVSPHPSGLSRWWNDPTNVRRARRFFRGLV